MGVVPETFADEGIAIFLDYSQLARAFGVEPTELGSMSRDDLLARLDDPSMLDGFQYLCLAGSQQGIRESDAFDDLLGFNIADTRVTVLVGYAPDTLCTHTGAFDVERITETVEADAGTNGLIEHRQHDGIGYFAWGPDDEPNAVEQSVARPIGVGGRMLAAEDRITWTHRHGSMEAAIDAATKPDARWLDDPSLAAVVDAIDSVDWVTGFINRVPVTDEELCGSSCSESVLQRAIELESLVDAELWGAAWGLGGDGEVIGVLVVGSTSDDAAVENTRRVVRNLAVGSSPNGGVPYASYLQVLRATTVGRASIVVLAADDGLPQSILDFLYARDVPVRGER